MIAGMATHYLACDLGAESGRLMLGTLDNGKLGLEEIHRFPNTPLAANGSLHWNMAGLFGELVAGLTRVSARGLGIAGISTDSWGVDYLLFDGAGKLMEPTHHYRDPRSARGVEAAFARVDWETIFAETGIQFMAINTVFQLASEPPERLRSAAVCLGVADGFNYLLSGVARMEPAMASTFQLYNPMARGWSSALIAKLGFPPGLLAELTASGTVLGPLKPELAQATGLGPIQVIAGCSHDTGAAVAAIPATGRDWAYLSSGTWSLIGVEIPEPIITARSRELNFTNEVGYGGSIRLLKNIVGLWIIQECRRAWAAQGREYDYGALATLAGEAEPFRSLINPADPRFVAPDGMPEKVAAFCHETGQAVPRTPGETIRCVLESLALLYRKTLRQAEELTGQPIGRLHIVGGGSKNQLLNQLTANAIQKPVLAGPVEATAAGNVLVQAITLGHLPSLAAAREVVRDSFPMTLFTPQDAAVWEEASLRFGRLPT